MNWLFASKGFTHNVHGHDESSYSKNNMTPMDNFVNSIFIIMISILLQLPSITMDEKKKNDVRMF